MIPASTSGRAAASIISATVLTACTQLAALDMHEAKPGMSREQAFGTLVGSPTLYSLKSGTTEYVLMRTTTSFTAMYSEKPYTVQFIEFENDKVVDRGVVDQAEQAKIKKVQPAFDLQQWQGQGRIPHCASESTLFADRFWGYSC